MASFSITSKNSSILDGSISASTTMQKGLAAPPLLPPFRASDRVPEIAEIGRGIAKASEHLNRLSATSRIMKEDTFIVTTGASLRKKRRYEKDGYDLDLTYMGPSARILTHGYPAIGIEHIYRNPRYELKRFLEEYHAKNYKVYNFC